MRRADQLLLALGDLKNTKSALRGHDVAPAPKRARELVGAAAAKRCLEILRARHRHVPAVASAEGHSARESRLEDPHRRRCATDVLKHCGTDRGPAAAVEYFSDRRERHEINSHIFKCRFVRENTKRQDLSAQIRALRRIMCVQPYDRSRSCPLWHTNQPILESLGCQVQDIPRIPQLCSAVPHLRL